jgi:hypothetical protein
MRQNATLSTPSRNRRPPPFSDPQYHPKWLCSSIFRPSPSQEAAPVPRIAVSPSRRVETSTPYVDVGEHSSPTAPPPPDRPSSPTAVDPAAPAPPGGMPGRRLVAMAFGPGLPPRQLPLRCRRQARVCDTKVERREKLKESRKILAYPYFRPLGQPRRARGDPLTGR